MLLRAVDLQAMGKSLQRCKRHIDAQALAKQQALSFAILAKIDDAGAHAVVGIREVHARSIELDCAVARSHADNAFHQLGSPRADKAREAENFAFPELERSVAHEAGNG